MTETLGERIQDYLLEKLPIWLEHFETWAEEQIAKNPDDHRNSDEYKHVRKLGKQYQEESGDYTWTFLMKYACESVGITDEAEQFLYKDFLENHGHLKVLKQENFINRPGYAKVLSKIWGYFEAKTDDSVALEKFAQLRKFYFNADYQTECVDRFYNEMVPFLEPVLSGENLDSFDTWAEEYFSNKYG